MSIMTCTNVHPDNEVVTIDKTYKSREEIVEIKTQYAPSFDNYHPLNDDDAEIDPFFFANKYKSSFTFNCSGGTGCLRWYKIIYTNMRTGDSFTSPSALNNIIKQNSVYYNGDTITSTNHGYTYYTNNGEDWQSQYVLYQSDKENIGLADNEPLFDMQIAKGKVLEVYNSTVGTSDSVANCRISKNIEHLDSATYLYEPTSGSPSWVNGKYVKDNDIMAYCYLIGGAVMEVGGKRYLIEYYNKSTGNVILRMLYDYENSHTAGEPVNFKSSDNYTIYTSYFYDKPRFIMNRSKPKVEFEVSSFNPKNLKMTTTDYGTYTTTFNYVDKQIQLLVSPNEGEKPDIETMNSYLTKFKPTQFDCTTIHCEGSYYQSTEYFTKFIGSSGKYTFVPIKEIGYYNFTNYTGLKCFQYSLYKVLTNIDGDVVSRELITQSDKIYSGNIEYDFYVPLDYGDSNKYQIILDIQTLENAMYSYESQVFKIKELINVANRRAIAYNATTDEYSFACKLDKEHSRCIVTYEFTDEFASQTDGEYYLYSIYRQEKSDDDEWKNWQLIRTTSPTDSISKGAIFDYFVGSGVEFRYKIIPMKIVETVVEYDGTNDMGYKIFQCYCLDAFISDTYKFDWTETLITSLTETTNNLYSDITYKVGDTWTFVTSPNSNNIDTNIGSYLYEGTNSMPIVVRNDKQYESSSFTIDLLQLNCSDGSITDDVKLVKKWVEFITGKHEFLLKTPKGDVWIVDIANENPSRSYDFGGSLITTNVTYSWVQVKNNTDVSFRWW